MNHAKAFLSNNSVCTVYQCLEGHIHLKYRGIDVAMPPQEFYQVAATIAEAMSAFKEESTESSTDTEPRFSV
jgi:tRNA/tmRNA/rRNA uracil-C5-methylase (TrmA/RlmC/RlmD family)